MTVQLHKRDIRAIRRETTATGRQRRFAIRRRPVAMRLSEIAHLEQGDLGVAAFDVPSLEPALKRNRRRATNVNASGLCKVDQSEGAALRAIGYVVKKIHKIAFISRMAAAAKAILRALNSTRDMAHDFRAHRRLDRDTTTVAF